MAVIIAGMVAGCGSSGGGGDAAATTQTTPTDSDPNEQRQSPVLGNFHFEHFELAQLDANTNKSAPVETGRRLQEQLPPEEDVMYNDFIGNRIDSHPDDFADEPLPPPEEFEFVDDPDYDHVFDPDLEERVEAAKGELIIELREGLTLEEEQLFFSENNTQLLRRIPETNLRRIRIPIGEDMLEFRDRMNMNPDVNRAHVNAMVRIPPDEIAQAQALQKAAIYLAQLSKTTPNDTSFSQQWHATQIGLEDAWDTETGDPGAVIAIIDTGVDRDHPDLAGKMYNEGLSIVGSTQMGDDDNGHGTHCAGIAAASSNNSTGVAGVDWNCKILPVKVLDSEGKGSWSDIVEGIRFAASFPEVSVISMSLSGSSAPPSLQEAIDEAWMAGKIIVAAAGNDNVSTPCFPAACNNVLAVASTNQSDVKSSFSNFGPWVDISAPGSSIYSTYINGTYSSMSGTSMATPMVAGLACLIKSRNAAAEGHEIERILKESATPLNELNPSYTGQLGAGRINAFAALRNIQAGFKVEAQITEWNSATGVLKGQMTLTNEFQQTVTNARAVIAIIETFGQDNILNTYNHESNLEKMATIVTNEDGITNTYFPYMHYPQGGQGSFAPNDSYTRTWELTLENPSSVTGFMVGGYIITGSEQ